jgi:competence protein ComEC
LLIDTGPLPTDVRSGLIPFILRRGISVLDAVVITHPHDDHAGGLRGVCSTFTVRRILTGKECRAGETIVWRSDCRLQVLYTVATTDTAVLQRMNANRTSIVLRLVYGRTVFVFAADAELPEEEQMVRAYGQTLHAGLLKVGHHGSAAGTGDDWLGAVSPGIAVISVGRMNKFGHPAHVTLDRLERRGIDIRRTDEEGAVLCVTDGDSIAVIEWH